jgi:hypothetical protein
MKYSTKIIKYLDLFGTRFTFYTENNPKLYTLTGGILSIISIFLCTLSFFLFSFDDLNRKYPITTTSYTLEGLKNVKFGDEKIWIPWRIVDYNNNEYVNHTGILFPIIYHISGIKDRKTRAYNYNTTILNYKLCSETSMANKSEIYHITIPLDEIYCIDMDDFYMGGSWLDEYINYIEFDLYYCKNGIDYDENNSDCSPFESIMRYKGEENSLDISVYYPLVQFQPTNKTYPMVILYKQFFYHLSKHSNKIDRLYIQENLLTDDSGWILKKEKNRSYWGLTSMNGDTYLTDTNSDLMKEGSSSRAYSFNIYFEPGVIHYKRYYKKLYITFSDFFPIAYIVFIIMKNVSKIFTQAESNKNMVELLFENLKEKPIFGRDIKKMRIKNMKSCKEMIIKNKLNLINRQQIKELNNEVNNSKLHQNSSSLILNIQNINISSTPRHAKLTGTFQKKSNKNLFVINNDMVNYGSSRKNNDKIAPTNNSQKRYIKEQLFPYVYYVYSTFIKNLDISKKNFFFSNRFAKIYMFLCQLYDITSYLTLQREFNALKKILSQKNVKLIEKFKKINVNYPNFMQEINDCIQNQKFHIFAQGIVTD